MEKQNDDKIDGEIPLKESEEKVAQDGKKTSSKLSKALGIAVDVILYLFLAICLFALIISLVSKKDPDGAVNLFGREMRLVVSQSMEKSEYSRKDIEQYEIKDLKLRSMVFIERVPDDEEEAKEWYSRLAVGDVLTFRYVIGSSQQTITHRIIEITPKEGGYVIQLQGDNRGESGDVSTQTIDTSESGETAFNYVIGKVTGSSTVLGYIVYGIKQPIGTALIVIVPCCIIIIWHVIRIISVVSEDRKKKAAAELEAAKKLAEQQAEEREKQAAELEEMKRRLAVFEGAANKSADGGTNEEK